MPIAEPTTTLTDLVLGVEALWLASLMLSRRPATERAPRLLALALITTGAGAFAGAVSHGFAPWLEGTIWRPLLWTATLLFIGMTSLLFLACAARATLSSERARNGVLALAVLQFTVYAVWVLGHDEFIWAIADFVPAMALALLLFVREARRGGPGAGFVVQGILLTFVGAAIQALGIAPHEHFNHNDLFHVVQMVAVYRLYRGGLLLEDRKPTIG